ncbi:CLUMA_CG009384, isoform B [Clunio marinus]|uniref:arginyltransferase n=1 Tax=Clunio marinus TaxID=568069 RepID=A0A1J1I8P0_9DIPT|nr:CLUMA_CG009384, isoform B [Clunio marinus]
MKFKFCGDGDCPDYILATIHSNLCGLSSIKLRILASQVVKAVLSEEAIDEKKFSESFGGSTDDSKAAYACIRFLLLSGVRYSIGKDIFSVELQQLGLPREHSLALGKVLDENSSSLREHLKSKALTINELIDVKFKESGGIDCIQMEMTIKNLVDENGRGIDGNVTKDINISKADIPLLLHDLKLIKSKMDHYDYENILINVFLFNYRVLCYGFWAHTLNVNDYQEMINRNWRRSGQYCYKPKNTDTCCPMYTIKCDALNFKLSKSHKKILKKMNRFLRDGTKSKDRNNQSDIKQREVQEMKSSHKHSDVKVNEINVTSIGGDKNVVKVKPCVKRERNLPAGPVGGSHNSVSSIAEKPSNPKKAKVIRIERKKKKLAAKGLTLADVPRKKANNVEKSLEDFLNQEPKDGKHRLEVKLIPSKHGSNETIFKLYQKYQMQVHKDPIEKLNLKSYERFLVNSPLQMIKDDTTPSQGFGSFHYQYYLDGVLIAVGVIDILPECVSSVYLYYDPNYSFLSLGTYASLREIALVRELYKSCQQLSNYYLGFYIPTCPKMRYKANIKPSFLLCPEVFTWHLLDGELSAKIDSVPYYRINKDEDDAEKVTEDNLGSTLVLANRTAMKYGDFKRLASLPRNLREDSNEVMEYAALVGRSLSQKMLLFRYIKIIKKKYKSLIAMNDQ